LAQRHSRAAWVKDDPLTVRSNYMVGWRASPECPPPSLSGLRWFEVLSCAFQPQGINGARGRSGAAKRSPRSRFRSQSVRGAIHHACDSKIA
jgi:hypothetical protein